MKRFNSYGSADDSDDGELVYYDDAKEDLDRKDARIAELEVLITRVELKLSLMNRYEYQWTTEGLDIRPTEDGAIVYFDDIEEIQELMTNEAAI